MRFKDTLQGDIAVFELAGRIIGQSDKMTLFHGRINEYINLRKNSVVVDLKRIEVMSSAGLGMLISAHKSVSDAGGRLVLANITTIEDLIAMTRLNRVFGSYDSVEEAIESFN